MGTDNPMSKRDDYTAVAVPLFRTVSTRAREGEWELGTLATDNIVRHSRRAEITTLHEVLWMRPRVPPTPPR
jgi:hypothetical protein